MEAESVHWYGRMNICRVTEITLLHFTETPALGWLRAWAPINYRKPPQRDSQHAMRPWDINYRKTNGPNRDWMQTHTHSQTHTLSSLSSSSIKLCNVARVGLTHCQPGYAAFQKLGHMDGFSSYDSTLYAPSWLQNTTGYFKYAFVCTLAQNKRS